MPERVRQPDLQLTLRRPAEPDDVANRRLRSFLKRCLRDHGYRVAELRVVQHDPPAGGEHQNQPPKNRPAA